MDGNRFFLLIRRNLKFDLFGLEVKLMKKNKGFTLIELLVVIAIIALLMSIVLPALSKVKETAKRVICGTHIRSVATGLHAYANSYDDLLPEPYTAIVGGIKMALPWRSVIAFDLIEAGDTVDDPSPTQLGVLYRSGYIDEPEVFYCPSQPRNSDYPFPYYYDFYTGDGGVEWGSQLFESHPGHWATRTSYNYWILGADEVRPTKDVDTKVRLAKLSNEPILFDNCQEWEVLPHKKNSTTETPRGISVSFSDGHVSFSKSEYLFSDDVWPKDFSAPMNGPGDRPERFEMILRELKRLQ